MTDFWATPLPLRVRLAFGALVLGISTLITAAVLYFGMQQVAARLDTALQSEARIARYSSLSTQTTTFLVIASESIQSGQSGQMRLERLEPVVSQLRDTYRSLHADVADAVNMAQSLGLGIDEQSRYGTQSLGLARMEAVLNNALRGLGSDSNTKEQLRTHIDTFASSIDPLLSQAVNTEVLFRNAILLEIDELRRALGLTAIAIAGLTVLLTTWFYFGLIRPQFSRLDRLREASQKITQEDFSIQLPETEQDEIGRLYSETNRMAAALSRRHESVQKEWARLNETIAARTEELRTVNEKLSEIDENRKRFFADVSHELRTPLTVILMEAQIGRKSGTGSQQAFATIESRAHRLNRRIDDLLRLARSDTGQLALEAMPTLLPDLIASVTEEVAAEIDSAGMELTVGEVPEIELVCDPNWIRQVLVGLIHNCMRHARTGQLVRLATRMDGKMIEITVTDNGPGMAPGDLTRIFDRFEQVGGEKSEGFGIGLALAHWVVEQQGGTITAKSPLPRTESLGDAPGTKIAVRLPVTTR